MIDLSVVLLVFMATVALKQFVERSRYRNWWIVSTLIVAFAVLGGM
mgnify:CR=1 FL=1